MSVAKKLAKKTIDEKLLKKLVPLNALGADRLRELAEKADVEHATVGRTLFKRGDTDAKTYYLLSGEITVQLANGQNVSIKADTPAALHPLLDARPRPATAVVESNATLLVIDAGLLDILVNYDPHQSYEVTEIQSRDETDWLTRFLQSLSAMNIPVQNIEHLMRRMQELPMRAGETVIRQTDADSQHYYVVKEGRCVVTKQATADNTPIRIAELTAGIGFGEEALLADQPRNANVTMITDGRLMRLPKADFTQLIADPALHYVSYLQAQQMVQSGAVWLDTRSAVEHRGNTLTGSTHIPLMALRSKVKELNAYGKYITFCDTGNRAAAAAFLLRQLGFSAYVLMNGLRDVPAAALHGGTQTAETTVPLKLRPQTADTVGDATSPAQAEHARMQQRIAELEAQRATADRVLATHQEQVRALQAQAAEYTLSLTAADAAYDAVQKELDGLNATHTRVTEKLQYENTQLQTRIAATTAEIEQVKNQLERAVERNRTAEETLHSAEREIARLRAETDAAQRHAEESLRRASESESLQSTILKEVQRKIAAAELMRAEAEEQAQRLREAAELSRKRAEQESRKVAEAETACAKAQDESGRRARLTEDLRKTADEEMARLKKEAETARANADKAQKKSQLADAARRRLEQEMQAQQAQIHAAPKLAEKPGTAASSPSVENDLDDLEQELAQLQQKLESKKRAAVARNQKAHQIAEKQRNTEPQIVQNVYDLHQKTQKLPTIKPHQAAPDDVGKVRKSGWISDSILWETTIGLREDSEAEKFLDNENVQRATAVAAATKRQETSARALASGNLKPQEANRSVFTARASAPTIQRRVDMSGRGTRRIGLITLLSAVAVTASIGAYVMLQSGDATPQQTTGVPGATPGRISSDELANILNSPAPNAATLPGNEPAADTEKAIASPNSINGAITRKETALPNAAAEPTVAKPKTDAARLPARKPVPTDQARDAAAAITEATSAPAPAPTAPEHDVSPSSQLQESATPTHTISVPMDASSTTQGGQDTRVEPAPPAEATPAPVVPTFTDVPQVN